MTDASDFEGEPIVRDKRRLDPETGALREPGAVGGESPAGGPSAGQAPSGAAADDAGVGVQEPGAEPGTGAGGDARAEALDLADQLARAKADAYNLEQRHNAYVKRSRAEVLQARDRGRQDVIEALVAVLDDVDLARQHGELTGPFASIADKLEGTLASSFGMTRFGEAGEEFDPSVHEALMHAESDEVQVATVQQVLQPGYRVGERVVRPARVSVVGPQ